MKLLLGSLLVMSTLNAEPATPLLITDDHGKTEIVRIDPDGKVFVEGKYCATSKRAAEIATVYGEMMKVTSEALEAVNKVIVTGSPK